MKIEQFLKKFHRLELDFDTIGPTDPSGLDECQNSRYFKVNVSETI
jgi:hypothetical protein